MNIEVVQNKLQQHNLTDGAIQAMSERFMRLTIANVSDKEGLIAVHAARMVVKNKRLEVEKVRKALKEDSLKFGRIVDGEAKRINALLVPIEDHLQAEEDKIAAIKAQLKAEEDRKAREAEEARLRAIEEARLAEIEKQRKADEERLAAVAAEQAAEKARLEETARIQAEKEAALRAEREQIEVERRAIERERELERTRQETAEQARREAELEKERAVQAERERVTAELEAAEKARLEAERAECERVEAERRRAEEAPDAEKLLAFADLLENIVSPSVTSARAIALLSGVFDDIRMLSRFVRDAAKEMGPQNG